MRYLKSELEEIIKNHYKWLNGEEGGCRANLRRANLDFSMLYFSCKSLCAKFSQKQIIQILYHAAMPTQNNAKDFLKCTERLSQYIETQSRKIGLYLMWGRGIGYVAKKQPIE